MAQYLSQNRIEEPVWLEPIDITFLRMRMSEIHCDLSRYAEIVQANNFLEAQISSELRLQRDAKFVELASIRNILSPVRRIPVEILSEIFELARLPEDGIFHSNHTIVLYTHSISSVCAAWRKVALATPRLWSKLCFDWEIYTKTVATKVEWVREWTHRSQSLPLDVYLSLRLGSASGQFLEQILDCRHRIRTLDVAGYVQPYLVLFGLPPSSFSQLEEVTLSIKKEYEAVFPEKIQAFLDAPNLHHVQIRGTSFSPSLLKALAFPTEQLKTLMVASGDQINPPVFIDTLHACKGLVNLEIDLPVSVHSGTTKIATMDISLPALKTLKIRCRDEIHCNDFLRCLTLPLLEHLTLFGNANHYWDTREGFPPAAAEFQRRSATSLSSLTLEDLDCNDVEILTKNLGIFPEVQALQLHRVQVDANLLLRALTYSEGTQVLLPKLTYLGLQPYELPYQRRSTRLSDDLTSMVLSRWWPDNERTTGTGLVRLQKVTLQGFLYDEKITRISGLSGLKIDYM